MNQNTKNNKNKLYQKYKKERKWIDFKELTLKRGDEKIHKTAIIVPYRNRQTHLVEFLKYMDSYLPKQFEIIIVEQNDQKPFNRGKLLNIGSQYAFNAGIEHIIHHDIDLIPDQNMFPYYVHDPIKIPVHLGWRWREIYTFFSYLGGVFSISQKEFEKINGYPNEFWGWGGEDDALFNRIAENKIDIYRPTTGNYKSLPHESHRDNKNQSKKKRENILKDLINWKSDGLNSLKYKLDAVDNLRCKKILCTKIKVQI